MTYNISYSVEDFNDNIEVGTFGIEANDINGLLIGLKITIEDELEIDQIKSLNIKCKFQNSENELGASNALD